MLQKIRVQLIRFRLSKKALSLMRKGKEFVTYGKKMVARGKVYLKKGKALIAKEKANQQKKLIIEDSLEVRDVLHRLQSVYQILMVSLSLDLRSAVDSLPDGI